MRLPMPRRSATTLLLIAALLPLPQARVAGEIQEPGASRPVASSVRNGVVADSAVHYRTMTIDGVDVFYREAGPANAPAIVLLHGFPSSSNMFRNLIPALMGQYHVIAPDYPGFGHSGMPDRSQFRIPGEPIAECLTAASSAMGSPGMRN